MRDKFWKQATGAPSDWSADMRTVTCANAGRGLYESDALEVPLQGPALRLTDLCGRHKVAVSEDTQHAWAC